MKKTITTLAIMTVLALTGCGDVQMAAQPSTAEHHVPLDDGRTVTCVAWKAGYAGGFSCDWAGAK